MNNALRPRSRRGGFTLLEIAVATIIIGVGLTALMATMRAGTSANSSSNKLTTSLFLAQNIHEWTRRLPFRDPDPEDAGNPPGPDGGTSPQDFVDDVDDLMDVTFCPPRDGTGAKILSLPDWSQTITMTWREPDDLLLKTPAAPTPAPGSTDTILVTVDIKYRGTPVYTMRYFIFDRTIPPLP